MGHVGSGDYLRRATELVRRSVLGRLGIAHIGGVSILGLYLALSAVEGAVYHYSFLYEQAPPTAEATSGAILGYAAYGLVASTVAYLTYAWMLAYALATVQRKPGLAWALRRVARSAPRSAWWGIPASRAFSTCKADGWLRRSRGDLFTACWSLRPVRTLVGTGLRVL